MWLRIIRSEKKCRVFHYPLDEMLCNPAAASHAHCHLSEAWHCPAQLSPTERNRCPSCFIFMNSLGIQSCCLFLSFPTPPKRKEKEIHLHSFFGGGGGG